MSTPETAAPETPTETEPSTGQLGASDVKTYATLAHAGTVLLALVDYPFMWVPATGLFLFLRNRDHGGLLRLHLAGAVSFSAVTTVYALVLRYVLDAANVHGQWLALYPVLVAAAVAYPSVRAVQAVQRLHPYPFPRPLAWLPLDRG
ncbi:MAG: hypothetical protein JWN52_2392 [Actinomycetia bacterium]|jgi:hypothetical protein|nr:hypothetical protein [Actinomycetes bacterium]